MRSFNSSNMADDNLNTSQANLQQQQAGATLTQQHRVDSLQELNEELAASQAHQRQPSATRAALAEMQPDLQYLAREAPLDGGESTFGAGYSTLANNRQQAPNEHNDQTTLTHTYSSTMTAARPTSDFNEHELENDYERAHFRLDQDELNGDSGGQLRADSAAAIRQASSEALEQLAPDNVDIQRPLQQAGWLLADCAEHHHGQQQARERDQAEEQEEEGAAEPPAHSLEVDEERAAIVVVETSSSATCSKRTLKASDVSQTPAATRPLRPFLVSFMVDARGGAMRGCRHSGVRVIIPPGAAQQPMRITCRYLRRERLVHPPPLMEGEACASKIMEVGPAGAKFLGPVLIEVPHFASLRGREREIIILRSDSGEVWREHLVETDEQLVAEIIRAAELAEREQSAPAYATDQENTTPRPSSAFGGPDDIFTTTNSAGGDPKQQQQQQERRLTRIVTNEFPQYFAIISRIRQEVHTVGPEGSTVDSQVVPKVQAIFTEGALTKRIKIGLQKKTKEAPSDQEEGERTPRARSPEQAASPAPSGSRPSSAAAKRRSRFLACFGASHGSHDPLGAADQSATDGELGSGSSANSSAGGDSPRQRANEKRLERRHIVEEVSDSERDDSSSLGQASKRNRKSSQLVPDDYYLEPESALLLNLSPKTYGKRMASSAAQTDSGSGKIERLSTSTRHDGKRRGLLGNRRRGRNKTQMTLPLHEPTSLAKQQQVSAAATGSDAPAADSSLESAIEAQGPRPKGSQIKSLLKKEASGELKCLTRTIQTDSDSVTVQYVTIYGASGAAEAVEAAAANSAASQKVSGAGQDDGYVSGSGELKRQEQASRAKGLFSPFCVGSKSHEADDSSIDDDEAALKVNEAGQLDVQAPKASSKTKAKKTAKQKKSKGDQDKHKDKTRPASNGHERAKSEASSEKLEIVLEAKTPELVSTAAESASGASSPTLQAATISPELASTGAEGEDADADADADESLLTSRSISPSGKEVAKVKLSKAEKAQKAKRDKLERQKRKELEEAQAKAEKARKKLEKEAKKKAKDKELRAAGGKLDSIASGPASETLDESSGSQEPVSQAQDADNKGKMEGAGFSLGATIAKTIQSVKFAPSATKSAQVSEEQQQEQARQQAASSDLAQDNVLAAAQRAQAESAGEKEAPAERQSAPSSPAIKLTKQVIDSMSSKFKVKLPKLGGSGSGGAGSSKSEAGQPAAQVGDQLDESMVHMSIGECSLPAARDVSFEDELQIERKASETGASLPQGQPKALKPILKQQSTTSEKSAASAAAISIGEPVKLLASELLSEATEEALRAADELAKRSAAAPESPSAASESNKSKKELARRAKAEREQAKKEAKLKAAAEKRLVARELDELLKKAQVAAKLAEGGAKARAQRFADEAEKQAKIAKSEAERALLEAELADITATVVAGETSLSSEPVQLSDSELKKRAKSAEAEAKRAAKEAKEEAKRLAKEAEAEAKLKAKEAKRLAKEAKQMLKLEAKQVKVKADAQLAGLPSAPSTELADVSLSESKSQEASQSEPQESPKSQGPLVEAKAEPEVAAAAEAAQQEEEESPSKSKSSGSFAIKLPSLSLPKFKGKSKDKKVEPKGEEVAAEEPEDEGVAAAGEQQVAGAVSGAEPSEVTEVKESERGSKEKEWQKNKKKKEEEEEEEAKEEKKSKRAEKAKKLKSGSSGSLGSSSEASAAEPASKSSLFSRLFKSKPEAAEAEAEAETEREKAGEEEIAKSSSERLERSAPESGPIVSEMYPSDPNNADGEMILEVNVPENMISQQQQQRAKEQTAEAGQLTSTQLTSSSVTPGEPLDEQEATLVNMSQLADEADAGDDDEATENALSQATNDIAESGTEQRHALEQEQHSQHEPQVVKGAAVGEQVFEEQPKPLEATSGEQPLVAHEGAAELKSEKARRQLEAKLEKEAMKRAAEEEKQRKKEAKEAQKRAEVEAKRTMKEAKELAKREAKEAKRLAELAKKEAKASEKAAQRNKAASGAVPGKASEGVEIKSEVEPRVITSTAVLSSSSAITSAEPADPAAQQVAGDEQFDEATRGRVLMSAKSGELPISEETEVERVVEELVGEDGTLTKRTKLVETKYVTLRQEEVRAVERRDIPADEWARQQAAERDSAGPAGQPSTSRSPMGQVDSAELDEIRAVPSYFDPDSLPVEIKPETGEKKAERKRVKLNQRLVKRALKLARSEAKKAKVGQKKAEAEIAVCDEAARQARKQLKRAVKEAKRAAKEVAKQHKKMDKTDKKLAKQAKKLDKRQKKIDKELVKAAKKADKKREKEAKKAAKKAGKRPSMSRSSSRSSKRSIKLEDISEPVLRSSSRLSIGRQQSLEPVGESSSAQPEVALSLEGPQLQAEQQQLTQEQIEQMVHDGEQVIVHTITKIIVNETDGGEPEVIEQSERVLTGREAEAAALRMELEASREEEGEIDVVGLAGEEPSQVSESQDHSQDQNQENQTPSSTPDVSLASAGSGSKSKSKKKRNKRQKSKESAE